jgi:hypothetical protein
MLLPRQELFLYMYVRKEAVLSSQIEGTQSTLSDLLRFETEAQAGKPFDDIREVSNYVDAMMYGLGRLEDLPLSLRLIREMHARLLQSGRGGSKSPGEFRQSQNWIGGTRPGASASLSSRATRAVISTSAVAIRPQAMRCMVVLSSAGPARARRPSAPFNTRQRARRRKGWGDSVARPRPRGAPPARAVTFQR